MKRGINIAELKDIQKNIAKGISLKNNFKEIKTIAGFDLAFKPNKIICSCVVLNINTQEILEQIHSIIDEPMSYSPRFICFREGPAYLKTYKQLENKPDILMLDGNGAINPKTIGIASHIGVLLNKPCIGISSKLITGRLDIDNVIVNEKITAKALKTKDFANPIYVSPGHDISLKTAIEITKKCLKGHKMPEPIHLAHNHAIKIKKMK